MEPSQIHNKGQARIFQNELLESLTKTRPWVIYSIYLPVSALMLWYSSETLKLNNISIISVFLLAMFCWTLFEYLAHRYLFHFPAKSVFGKRIVYIFHENHHEFPRDTERLFMPPLPSILLGSIVFGIIAAGSILLTGAIADAFVFFPGFICGYLIYVSMHYAIHAYAPPKMMKALWRNHHLHHYKYPEKGFGVSSTLWDRVFGTTLEHPNDKQNRLS